ncbi:hypothetical protein HZS_4157 [Henneguya salminicola]|nr:hypothetical protein HZS_4157 [Henneguya salminicola]
MINCNQNILYLPKLTVSTIDESNLHLASSYFPYPEIIERKSDQIFVNFNNVTTQDFRLRVGSVHVDPKSKISSNLDQITVPSEAGKKCNLIIDLSSFRNIGEDKNIEIDLLMKATDVTHTKEISFKIII